MENHVTPTALIKGLGNSILDQVGGGKGDDNDEGAARPRKGGFGNDRGGVGAGGEGKRRGRGRKGGNGVKKRGTGERLTEVADDILTVLERLDAKSNP